MQARRKPSPASTSLVRLCAALGMMVLAACEIIEGLGQDIESGGEAIEEAS